MDARLRNGAIVTGATRLLGIVGHPIEQVRAPALWSAMFRKHGLNLLCLPLHVVPAELDSFFKGLRTLRNLAGLIVTIPHKLAAVGQVDLLTGRAELVQSVNFIAVGDDGALTGDIVDGIGMVGNLRGNGADPAGKRTLLLGAGGVGTAIAFALAEAGVSDLVIYDLEAPCAASVAARVAATGAPARFGPPDPAGFDLVVNATPLGMKPGDPLPVDPARISPGAVVADVVVHQTPLLERAAARGCGTFDGIGMTVHQLETMAGHLGLGAHDFSPPTVQRVADGLAL